MPFLPKPYPAYSPKKAMILHARSLQTHGYYPPAVSAESPQQYSCASSCGFSPCIPPIKSKSPDSFSLPPQRYYKRHPAQSPALTIS